MRVGRLKVPVHIGRLAAAGIAVIAMIKLGIRVYAFLFCLFVVFVKKSFRFFIFYLRVFIEFIHIRFLLLL